MDILLAGAAYVLQYALRVLGIGKFHNKRIVFFSFFGKQYSCNPKYLCEYLMQHYPEYEIVWAFDNPQRFSWLEERNVRLVRYNSLAFVRTCLTSRYVITNSQVPSWLPVLRRQTLINTWHGGGAYKRVGTGFLRPRMGKRALDALSRHKPCVYLSSSRAFTQLTIRQSFEHTGAVLECGMPRNDMLVHLNTPEVELRVRAELHIPRDTKILLYAPTYREDRKVWDSLLGFDQIHEALVHRFGGKWIFVTRMHYLVSGQIPKSLNCIDASTWPDMQELLYTADILVTDYSSSIWDFGLTGRPCFLYTPDLDDYDVERGFYSDIHTWPWPLAQTGKELARNIEAFDDCDFQSKLEQHYRDLGSTDTGNASASVATWMYEACQ